MARKVITRLLRHFGTGRQSALQSTRRNRGGNHVDLRVEGLEDRRMLSAGDFDTDFGDLLNDGLANNNGGIVISHVGPATAQMSGTAVVELSDGKILVGGHYQSSGSVLSRDLAVLRYNPDGSLDTTFGVADTDGINGMATIAVASSQDTGLDMTVDSQGRIVIVGVTDFLGNVGNVIVARFLPSGAPDTSFDGDGYVIKDFGAPSGSAEAVAVDASDNIVVGGRLQVSGTDDFLAMRFSGVNGAPDTSFDGDGMVTTSFGGSDRAEAVQVQSDGKIVLGGMGGSGDFALARYNLNGSPDSTFGTTSDGKVLTDVSTSGNDTIEAMAIDSFGQIIVAGESQLGFGVIARYSATGVLDSSSFATGSPVPGTLRINFDSNSSTNEEIEALAIQPDGTYVVAGGLRNGSNVSLYVARVTDSGVKDTSFNSGGPAPGSVVTDLSGTNPDKYEGVVVQADGKILAAGVAGATNIVLGRYDSGLLSADAGGPYFVDEPGGSVSLTGTAVGAGTLTYEWDLDDDGIFGETGLAAANGDENLQNPTFSVSSADGPAVFNVTVRVSNGSETAEDSTTVAVENVAPTATLGNDGPALEGGSATVSFTGQFDPSADDTSAGFRYSYDFDNDGTWDVGDGSYGGSDLSDTQLVPAGLLADGDANLVVKGRILDDDGGFTDYLTTIAIVNVAPTLTISGVGSVDEGSVYTLNLSSTDPGDDTITGWTISWGDMIENIVGNPASVTHTYADGGNPSTMQTISATATDEDGTFNSNSIDVDVLNVAPTLTISGVGSVNEGSVYTLNLSSTDPGDDTITGWTISWGDMIENIVGNPASVTHTYADGGNPSTMQTISATATDEDGTFNSNSIDVDVLNVAPTADTGGSYFTFDDTTIPLSGSGTDPAGANDPLTFLWDLDGDGLFGETGAGATRGDEVGANPTFDPNGLGTTSWTVYLKTDDGDGGISSVATGIIDVLGQGTELIGGVLHIVGTDSNDIVVVSKQSSNIKVVATFNDDNPVLFALLDVDEIQVRVRGGNDVVVVTNSLAVPTTIDGGSGKDVLTAGGGDTVIYGGTGNDVLIGGKGNNVLIGGDGSDKIVGGAGRDLVVGGDDSDILSGGSGDDILIGGWTVYDDNTVANRAAIDAIMALWTSSASFDSRVTTLTQSGGLLESGAVFDDDDFDVIIGGGGHDLLFADTNLWDGAVDLAVYNWLQDALVAVN